VFITGLEDGLLPHYRSGTEREVKSDDEERRLAYVAVSRAQLLLYLVYCRTRRLGSQPRPGRSEQRQPSRFLRALPGHLLERVDRARAA
jgi:DNA helicase II / ATP-dependent DNA helicase PcrA